tara:strand:+ start:4759 stop:5787 length:1029 start_codon:yes stop_codon:yes gene_type:complete
MEKKVSESILETLRLGWIDLAGSGSGSGGGVRTQRVELRDVVGVVVRLTLDQDCRGLLLDIPVTPSLKQHATRSVLIEERLLEIDSEPRSAMQLRCSQPRLNEVFALLATGIVARMCAGTRGADAVVGAIGEFRDLLRTDGDRLLKMEQELGLFGELVVLERLASTAPDAVRDWTGPLGERWDFKGPHGAIEVKTTRDRDFAAVAIASLDQLEPPKTAPLHLVSIAAELDSGSGRSVRSVIDAVLDTGVRGEELWPLLRAVGYDEDMHERGSGRRFTVLHEQVHRVCTGFPCLTRHDLVQGDVPSGVHDVAYRLNLSHASEFLLNEGQARKLFATFHLGGRG